MSPIKSLFVCLALIFAAGCKGVYVEQPIGVAPYVIVPSEWEGQWLASSPEDGETAVYVIQVINAGAGVVDVRSIEGDALKLWRLYLRTSGGDLLFASTSEEEGAFEPPQGKGYVWAPVRKNSESILFWLPQSDPFAKLISEERLPGRLEPTFLGPLRPEDYEFLRSPEASALYDWSKPAILTRVAK